MVLAIASSLIRFNSQEAESRTLDNQVRAEDTHGGNTNTGLGSAVGGTETREDDGGRAAHRAEEGLRNISIWPLIPRMRQWCFEMGQQWLVVAMMTAQGDVAEEHLLMTYSIDGATELELAFVPIGIHRSNASNAVKTSASLSLSTQEGSCSCLHLHIGAPEALTSVL
jgi:hypothetical protein